MTWRSKKQSVISLSSAEAKYCALHHATTELTLLSFVTSVYRTYTKGAKGLNKKRARTKTY